MIYFLIAIFIVVFLHLFLCIWQTLSGSGSRFALNKSIVFSRKFLYLLVTYLFAFSVTILYYSRDVYYYNIIQDYFYLPKSLWRKLAFLPISRFSSIRLLNAASLLAVTGSCLMALDLRRKKQRGLFCFLCVYLIFIYILYDPGINIAVYYFLYPKYITASGFTELERILYICIRTFNCLIVLSGALFSLVRHHSLPRIAGIRAGYLLRDICYLALCSSYILLLSISPAFVLHISKFAGTYSYKPIKLYYQASSYNILPYFWTFFLLLMVIISFKILHTNRLIRNNNMSITKQIDASETTTRIFCHYIKNELLALQAELELYRLNRNSSDLDSLEAHLHSIYGRVSEIHGHTRLSVLSMRQENLQHLITQSLEACGSLLKDVAVSCSFPEEPVILLLDKTYFSQAIHNLVSNSVEAMSEMHEKKHIRIRCHVSRSFAVLEISDNGKGIPADKLSQVFTPYYSSYPCTRHWGIGLSIVYKIIAAHGGQIEVSSTLGEGTTFSIYLPNTAIVTVTE